MSETEQIEITDGILKGTTWSTVQKITRSGINTVGDLARQTPSQLASQSGVGVDTCEKYIAIALGMVSEGVITAEQYWERVKNRRKLHTGSYAVDEVLRSDNERERGVPGGIESQVITEIAAEKGAGKTQMCHQFAVNAQLPVEEGGLGGNVVWIDTENTFRPDRIAQICKHRGYDESLMLKGIFYQKVYNSSHQLMIISQLPRLCYDHNVKLVIVDSMIAQLRSEYIGREMLARRQQLLNDILERLSKISQNHGLTVVYTNQVMDKPTPYGDPVEAVGGNIMGHKAVLRLFIRRGRQGTRIMRVTKSPYLPENEAKFLITNRGIEDAEDYKPAKEPVKEEEKDGEETA